MTYILGIRSKGLGRHVVLRLPGAAFRCNTDVGAFLGTVLASAQVGRTILRGLRAYGLEAALGSHKTLACARRFCTPMEWLRS